MLKRKIKVSYIFSKGLLKLTVNILLLYCFFLIWKKKSANFVLQKKMQEIFICRRETARNSSFGCYHVQNLLTEALEQMIKRKKICFCRVLLCTRFFVFGKNVLLQLVSKKKKMILRKKIQVDTWQFFDHKKFDFKVIKKKGKQNFIINRINFQQNKMSIV